MATVTDEFVRSMETCLQEQLTLSEAFLFMLWSCGIFLRKFAGQMAVWITDQFLSSLRKRGGLNEESSDLVSDEGSRIEGEVTFVSFGEAPEQFRSGELIGNVDRAEETPVERPKQGKIAESCTLLLGLSDGVVSSRIWPLLVHIPSPSLLFRLQRVSRCWRDFVGLQDPAKPNSFFCTA